MSETSKLKRRVPKVLADEVRFALHAVRDLGHERVLELLEDYRHNRVRCIATWGVLSIGAPVQGLRSVPAEHFNDIARLDEAFRKLHAYRNGGAGDYAAVDVERAINRLRAQEPRQRPNDYEEIGKWLHRRGYTDGYTKKDALVDEAVKHFQTSESTVRRALSACEMTKKKPSVT